MTRKIKSHLLDNPSYMKWGITRLANKFGCSERTMKSVLNSLAEAKQIYLTSLKG